VGHGLPRSPGPQAAFAHVDEVGLASFSFALGSAGQIKITGNRHGGLRAAPTGAMKASCGKVGTALRPKRYGNKQLRARTPPDGAQRALAQHLRYDTAQIPGRQNACDWRTFRMEQLAVYSDID